MRTKSIVLDFKKTKVFKKEVGIHCVVYNLYFFRIWLLDSDILDMIKRSHDVGLHEGRQILKN